MYCGIPRRSCLKLKVRRNRGTSKNVRLWKKMNKKCFNSCSKQANPFTNTGILVNTEPANYSLLHCTV